MNIPEAIGYTDDGECPKCRNDETDSAKSYTEDGTPYIDIYCTNCGSILEIEENLDNNASDDTKTKTD